MINITEIDDFTSREGIEKAKAGIQSALDALFNSSPCTGGSTLQFLNIAQWGESAIKKIKGHYKLFRKLWAAFEEVAEHAIALGAASNVPIMVSQQVLDQVEQDDSLPPGFSQGPEDSGDDWS